MIDYTKKYFFSRSSTNASAQSYGAAANPQPSQSGRGTSVVSRS